MFWKNVRRFLSNKDSIILRLTFLYSLSTAFIITMLALFLYGMMIEVLYKSDRQFLSDEARIVKNILVQTPYDIETLNKEVVEVPHSMPDSVYDYYIRILDNQNRLIVETPGAKKVFSESITNAPFNKVIERTLPRGGDYLFMQVNINAKHRIQIMLDISYQRNIINKYGKIAVVLLLLGTIFAIFLGYVIARKSMQRLRELTDTTQKITTSSLSQRLNPTLWPKELSELGKAFNRMLQRIEDDFLRLTQFSSDLAHELRTPINNLMGETEVALSQNTSAEGYRQVLESNIEELQRLSHMVEDLLFIARAESPQLEIKKSVLNSAEVIQSIIDFYEIMADEKQIKIHCEGNARVSAHPIMFRRMISNLLSNAIKYTLPNGSIRFEIHQQNSTSVQITLQDNGIGIEQIHLPHIFDRFYRTDAARSQHSGGIGLGLAIVKSIVELHQGKISISSQPNAGTLIQLSLPT